MSDVIKPPSRWLRVALVVSLCVNVLLVGLAVGAALNFRKSGGPPRNFDVSVGVLGRAMTAEDRRAVGEALRALPHSHGPGRRDVARMVDELTGLLRAEPFDAEAFAATLQRQGKLRLDMQSAGQGIVVARIAAMSAGERAAFADRIEDQARRGPTGPDRQ